jgi:hypothetical protein
MARSVSSSSRKEEIADVAGSHTPGAEALEKPWFDVRVKTLTLEFLHFPGFAGTAESWQDRTHGRSVRCAFLQPPNCDSCL